MSLLPYQVRIAEAFRRSRLVVAVAARRVGLTYALAAVAREALYDGKRVTYVASSPELAEAFHALPGLHNVTAVSWQAIMTPGDLHIIDYAAFIPADCVVKALVQMSWGGRVIIASSQDHKATGFNHLVDQVRSGEAPGELLTTTLSDALRDGLFSAMYPDISGLSGEQRKAWERGVRHAYGKDAARDLDCIPTEAPA